MIFISIKYIDIPHEWMPKLIITRSENTAVLSFKVFNIERIDCIRIVINYPKLRKRICKYDDILIRLIKNTNLAIFTGQV